MKYEPALDGLRAFAVTAVVLFHAFPTRLPGGWIGVEIFFVLSGYLITRVLLNEIASRSRVDLKSFYIRRCLRLMPAFVALLIVMLIATLIHSRQRIENLESIAVAAGYLMNWNRAFAWLPQGHLGHTWSLAMEEQYYLIWPLLIGILKKGAILRWLCCIGCLVVIWRVFLAINAAQPERLYNGFDTHSDGLLIGCVLACFFHQKSRFQFPRIGRTLAIVPVTLLGASFFVVHYDWYVTETIGFSISALMAAWLISVVRFDGIARRLFSLRPIVYTGKISYGWYLWHFPILEAFPLHLPHGRNLILVALSYLVAMSSAHFVEKPFLQFKRRFELGGPPPSRNPVMTVLPPLRSREETL